VSSSRSRITENLPCRASRAFFLRDVRLLHKQKQADDGQPVGAVSFGGLGYVRRFLPDFFAAAQRRRIASAIRFRAAADMIRRLGALDAGVDLFALPGGRPRRFAPVSALTPSSARIAASSLLRSSLSCCTISLTFIEVS
jgi:hypothetical protein